MSKPRNTNVATPAQRMRPLVLDHQTQPGGWLSIARAAARAGCCPRTVKRWIKGGLLSAARTPSPKGMGHLRVRLGDLEALMARGTLQ
jgi:hypothetical protein